MVMDFAPDLLTVVESATVIVSFVMMGAGLPLCLNMYKQRSTANVPYLLFLISLFLSSLGLQYGIMMSNRAVILINGVSLLVWGAYTGIYILVSKTKSKPVLRLLGIIGLYSAHLYYLYTLPSIDQLPTLGKYMIVWVTIISIVPAGEIFTIIQEKSTKCCNLPFLFGGTLNAAVWCLYGFLVNDINIYFPSFPGLFVSFIKFSLMFLYGFPTAHSGSEDTSRDRITNKDFDNNVYKAQDREKLRHRK